MSKENEPLSSFNFKSNNMLLVVILAVITLGFYWSYWVFRNINTFNALQTRTKINFQLPLWYTISLIISLVLSVANVIVVAMSIICLAMHGCFEKDLVWSSGQFYFLQLVVNFSTLFNLLILEIMTFRLKSILEEYSESIGHTIKLSKFWTFSLVIIYIQFKINELLEDKDKELIASLDSES